MGNRKYHNEVVMIHPVDGSTPYNVYCFCGLVLLAKLDGRSSTWHYNSNLWDTTNVHNPTSLSFNKVEAKMEAYNRFPIIDILVFAMMDINATIDSDILSSDNSLWDNPKIRVMWLFPTLDFPNFFEHHARMLLVSAT